MPWKSSVNEACSCQNKNHMLNKDKNKKNKKEYSRLAFNSTKNMEKERNGNCFK